MSAPAGVASNPITMRRVVFGVALAVVGLACVVVPWAFYLLILAIGLVSLYELNALCVIKGQPLVYPVAMLGVPVYRPGGLRFVASLGRRVAGRHRDRRVLDRHVRRTAGLLRAYCYTLLAVLYIGKC